MKTVRLSKHGIARIAAQAFYAGGPYPENAELHIYTAWKRGEENVRTKMCKAIEAALKIERGEAEAPDVEVNERTV